MKFSLFLFILLASLKGYSQTTFDNPYFNMGTKWTYETVEGPLPIQYGYIIYQITDTAQIQQKDVFVIENDYDNTLEYMHIEGSKIYFWDEASDTFQLTYSFEENQYNSLWHGVCGIDSGHATIHIDSANNLLLGNDTVEYQYISIKNNGTTTEDIETGIYKYIGLKEFGLRLPLGKGLCDFPRVITHLRCFDNDSVSYNFTEYPCDSAWSSLATEVIDEQNLRLFPNPGDGIIHIAGIESDMPYELFNLQGQKIENGKTDRGKITITESGIFILRIEHEKGLFIRKILVQ